MKITLGELQSAGGAIRKLASIDAPQMWIEIMDLLEPFQKRLEQLGKKQQDLMNSLGADPKKQSGKEWDSFVAKNLPLIQQEVEFVVKKPIPMEKFKMEKLSPSDGHFLLKLGILTRGTSSKELQNDGNQ